MIVQGGEWFILWFAKLIFICLKNIWEVLIKVLDEVDFVVDPVAYIYCDLVLFLNVLPSYMFM